MGAALLPRLRAKEKKTDTQKITNVLIKNRFFFLFEKTYTFNFFFFSLSLSIHLILSFTFRTVLLSVCHTMCIVYRERIINIPDGFFSLFTFQCVFNVVLTLDAAGRIRFFIFYLHSALLFGSTGCSFLDHTFSLCRFSFILFAKCLNMLLKDIVIIITNFFVAVALAVGSCPLGTKHFGYPKNEASELIRYTIERVMCIL